MTPGLLLVTFMRKNFCKQCEAFKRRAVSLRQLHFCFDDCYILGFVAGKSWAFRVCVGQWRIMPVRVNGSTATGIPTDIATSPQLQQCSPAARTTPTANATLTGRRHTPTPRASTSMEPISKDAAITMLACVAITGLEDSAIIEGIVYTPVGNVVLMNCITVIIAIIIYTNMCTVCTMCPDKKLDP